MITLYYVEQLKERKAKSEPEDRLNKIHIHIWTLRFS